MPDDRDAIALRIEERIADIPAAEWDSCAAQDAADANPFVSHAFLSALEESGSVGREAGWLPHHLALDGPDGKLAAAVPLYIKSHSQGEYVFDWGWADAYERAGGRYYPKLQAAVPFTPVTGPRLLVRPGPERDRLRAALAAGLVEAVKRYEVSSAHVTFAREDEARFLAERGFLLRIDHQYHWHNRGYTSFDDFLGALSSRKRKMIRKEREQVTAAGVSFRVLDGREAGPREWDAFFRFYVDTYDRKWGYPYLTREFFEIAAATMPDRIALVLAYAEGRPIAGAINYVGGDGLFGRNWGAVAQYKFLHFETCYYQAIDYAIRRGLRRVEAGTRGPHKIQRGYEPVPTFSAHWIADPGFRDAVARFLERERAAEDHERRQLADFLPYRQENG
ncbi:MAG: GNAT family N-acetyltransferase [Alphaproteobacteria bacterium]